MLPPRLEVLEPERIDTSPTVPSVEEPVAMDTVPPTVLEVPEASDTSPEVSAPGDANKTSPEDPRLLPPEESSKAPPTPEPSEDPAAIEIAPAALLELLRDSTSPPVMTTAAPMGPSEAPAEIETRPPWAPRPVWRLRPPALPSTLEPVATETSPEPDWSVLVADDMDNPPVRPVLLLPVFKTSAPPDEGRSASEYPPEM
jgi:hypothetical protein